MCQLNNNVLLRILTAVLLFFVVSFDRQRVIRAEQFVARHINPDSRVCNATRQDLRHVTAASVSCDVMHHVTTDVIMHVTPRPLMSAWEAATHDDEADGQGQGRENANVNDAYFDPILRMAVLVSELIVGTFGCLLLCVWLARQRKRKSRINALLCHVNISDLLVFLIATMPQLIWEACGRHWALGLTACRTFKFSQSCVMMASNFMLVVLSVDRHNAIVTPLRPPIQVRTFHQLIA